MTILLVEDDTYILEAVVDCLKDARLEVMPFARAREALDGCPDRRPEILVTDIDLRASEDGYWLADMARQRWPGLPVVFMSARPAAEVARHLLGQDKFLPKPFTSAQLIDAVCHAYAL